MKYILLFYLLFTFSHYTFSQNEEQDIEYIAPRFNACENLNLEIEELQKCAKDKLDEYIYKHLKYPRKALINRVEGHVVVQFTVTKEGNIKDIMIARDIGANCGKALYKVIRKLKKQKHPFIPGKMDGVPTFVKFTLPVSFFITE